MDEEKIFALIEEIGKELPRFEDGRINYRTSDKAPVVSIFVTYKDDILLLKRSDKVRTYQGKWNTVAGYLDEIKPIKEKVLEELQEELKITESDIENIHFGEFYELHDPQINKTWFVQPVLVIVKEKPEIEIDWEHVEFKWIKKEEISNFDIVPGIEKSLENSFK